MKNLLEGLSFGVKQTVGVMSVIPLIGEDISDRFASSVDFVRTSNYGVMEFNNPTDKIAIVPSGYSILTKQQAQDHGTPFSHLVKPNERSSMPFACCIEETQPGYINGKGINDFSLLPLYVRKKHFENYLIGNRVNDLSFSRLWNIISEFQKDLVKEHNAHLIYFFNKFMDKLNEFNAEFEVVPNQRGAIILLNDRIVGIEIAPTHEYWSHLWKPLIRDCYGSEVIRLTTSNLIEEFKSSQEFELSLEDCKTLEEIENALIEFTEKDTNKSKETLESVLSKEFEDISAYPRVVQLNNHEDVKYSLFHAKDKSAYGELYKAPEGIVYCSMLLA